MKDQSAEFDLIVVGGGVQGAFVALEASLAGWKVLLLEKGDFGGETSANSLKILHGGLRYLQHGSLGRIIESRHSVAAFRAVAGPWLDDRRFFLPTEGSGLRSRAALSCALTIHDFLGFLFRDGGDRWSSRTLKRGSLPEPLGDILGSDATGYAEWRETVMSSSAFVVWTVVRAAISLGADCRNYSERVHSRSDQHGVSVEVRDMLKDEVRVHRARYLIDASGPGLENRVPESLGLLRSVNLVFQGRPMGDFAVGVESTGAFRDAKALVQKGSRFLFFVPHGHCTLAGTWYDRAPMSAEPVSEADIHSWVAEVGAAAPGCGLTRKHLIGIQCGWLPSDPVADKKGLMPQPAGREKIFRLERRCLALRSVKFTAAPAFARKALRMLGCPLRRRLRPNRGVLAAPDDFFPREEVFSPDRRMTTGSVKVAVERARVRRATDALLRRNPIGFSLPPGETALRCGVDRLGSALGWNDARREEEMQLLRREFRWAESATSSAGG